MRGFCPARLTVCFPAVPLASLGSRFVGTCSLASRAGVSEDGGMRRCEEFLTAVSRGFALGVVLLVSAAGACSDPLLPEATGASIEARTDRESYALGETGLISIANHYPRPLTVDWCIHITVRREFGEWVATGPSAICTAIGIAPVRSGETRVEQFTVGGPLFPGSGEYRFATYGYNQDHDPAVPLQTFPVFSNPFFVTVD